METVQELTTTNQQYLAVEQIEEIPLVESVDVQRAVAETQAQVLLARKFPRNEYEAHSKIIKACERFNFASSAVYSYPRAGTTVSGGSISLAREIKKYYKNIQSGSRIISQDENESKIEVVAWDLESNCKQSKIFIIKHERVAKGKTHKITDFRDLRELIENYTSRYERSCIFSLIPSWIIEDALNTVDATLARGDSAISLDERIKKMFKAFDILGVKVEDIGDRLGHPVSSIDNSELAELQKIYVSLKDGITTRKDWFRAYGTKEISNETNELNAKLTAKNLVPPSAS